MTLIEKLLDKGQEAIDAAKRPFVIKKLKRSFESAIDSANETNVNQELKIQELRLKLVKEPEKAEDVLNDIIKCREEMRKVDRTIEIVEAERAMMFEDETDTATDPA